MLFSAWSSPSGSQVPPYAARGRPRHRALLSPAIMATAGPAWTRNIHTLKRRCLPAKANEKLIGPGEGVVDVHSGANPDKWPPLCLLDLRDRRARRETHHLGWHYGTGCLFLMPGRRIACLLALAVVSRPCFGLFHELGFYYFLIG